MGKKKPLYGKKATKLQKERARLAISMYVGEEIEYRPDVSELVSKSSAGASLYELAKRGASIEELASYRHEVLKAAVSHLQIPDRSTMTRKIEMAEAIYRFAETDKARPPKKDPVKPKKKKSTPKEPKTKPVSKAHRKSLPPTWLRDES